MKLKNVMYRLKILKWIDVRNKVKSLWVERNKKNKKIKWRVFLIGHKKRSIK